MFEIKSPCEVKRGDVILWKGRQCEVLYCGPHEMAGGLYSVFVKDEELGEEVFSIRASEKLECLTSPED